ncbi:MAG: serine hydrolase [Sphingobacteriales bacterium]|uniref:serine hydrolase n=1 Tax=Hydrotalea flava TaxID=714549 RepID=UPI0008296AE8|nr:serine hydrolase [Hydrotalea flava]RTL54220.1 MAG: serine hydrolase [Sphingobacteriales bacterium]
MHIKSVLLFLLLILGVVHTISAQKTDKKLTRQIAQIMNGFHGQVGIYVHDLHQNKVVQILADTVFPTASMVKIPIMIMLMDKMKSGELAYHQPFTYSDSLVYPGVDMLASFKSNEKIELSKLMLLMLSLSDNTASLWLQQIAGGGTRINALMDSLGYQQTRVNSRTAGREANRNAYGWGQTTPYEMANIMERMVAGHLLGQPYDAKMLRLLGRNYWDEEAISQIPADVFVASKNGAVDASRSEVLFVNGKKASYIFCICTNHNSDQSWESNNEAWELTRKISKLLWDYYH